MSQPFDSGHFSDFSQSQSDRLQQFGSPENGNKLWVDMADPSNARHAESFSQGPGQNSERQPLSHSGQLTFDDPYASTVGNGSWNRQNSGTSAGQDGVTGGAASAITAEIQIEQDLVKIEQGLANLVSLLENYVAAETASNAVTTTPAEQQQIPAPPAGSNDNTSSASDNSSTDSPSPNGTTTTNTTSGTDTATNTGTGTTGDTATNTDTATDTGTAPVVAAGDGSGFQVNNGKLTYNGRVLDGVNVSSQYAQSISPDALANQLTSELPGINVVRLMTSPEGGSFNSDVQIQNPETTSDIQADIQALNAKGIGVIVDNHSADSQNPDNVSQDGNEAQWFATIAKQNLGNNGVMFQPQNEPTGTNEEIVNEQVAVYNAIRDTGSNNVIAFDLGGGYDAAPQLSDPSAYDSMSNYAIDAHAYVADSTPVSDIQYEAKQTASLTEANGQAVPVYFGETGNSISNGVIQSAADQLLQAEFTNGDGAIAFNFDHAPFALDGSSQADNMTDGNGNLNAYGQYVASLIQQSSNAAAG